jgi:four helix bundle protein
MEKKRSSFRDVEAWKKARRLVAPVYRFTDAFPPHEAYILIRQMRRAVHSAHANIAEGRGRLSNGEWQQFLGQARGSLMELESYVISACDLKYGNREATAELGNAIVEAIKTLNGLLKSSTHRFATKKYK